ncbi:unnamed protein product [Cuscuta campestris]|uniref:Uncharacterized protein n=1 Tax=Cuscuta campestris TaxID=132261 RepID=A0A484M7X3_9ASTE|nr:unnamed protein product [Cuscuta campestris]
MKLTLKSSLREFQNLMSEGLGDHLEVLALFRENTPFSHFLDVDCIPPPLFLWQLIAREAKIIKEERRDVAFMEFLGSLRKDLAGKAKSIGKGASSTMFYTCFLLPIGVPATTIMDDCEETEARNPSPNDKVSPRLGILQILGEINQEHENPPSTLSDSVLSLENIMDAQ